MTPVRGTGQSVTDVSTKLSPGSSASTGDAERRGRPFAPPLKDLQLARLAHGRRVTAVRLVRRLDSGGGWVRHDGLVGLLWKCPFFSHGGYQTRADARRSRRTR
jgi:hypothetical protein